MKSLIRNLWFGIRQSAAPALVAAVLVLAGCDTPTGGPSTSQVPGAPAQASAAALSDSADKMKVGEKITIEISDVPSAPAPYTQVIRDDGSISLPLNNLTVVAAGKNKTDLMTEIHDLYVPRFFRRMTVNLKTEDRYFSVGGEVRQPGRLGYIGQVTIVTAIQAAGDFTDFARKTKVVIIRANGKTEYVDVEKALIDPKYNVPIYPGDTIHVKRRIL